MRATENGKRWFVGARERSSSDCELTKGARQGVPEKSCQTRGAREKGKDGGKRQTSEQGSINNIIFDSVILSHDKDPRTSTAAKNLSGLAI